MEQELNYVIFKKEYNYYESLKKRCSTEMYIGRTCNEKNRMRSHFDIKKPKLAIDKAIKKHGKDAFDYIVLKTYPNEKECVPGENYHIKLFNTYNDGYNSVPGYNKVVRNRYTHIIEHNDDQISISTKPTGIYAGQWLEDTPVVFRISIDNVGAYIDCSDDFKTHLLFLLYDDHNSPLKEIVKKYGRSAFKVEILEDTTKKGLSKWEKRLIKEHDPINIFKLSEKLLDKSIYAYNIDLCKLF